jgi:hypothetical protein
MGKGQHRGPKGDSFTSAGRFETIIFSDPWVTALAVAGVAAARAR